MSNLLGNLLQNVFPFEFLARLSNWFDLVNLQNLIRVKKNSILFLRAARKLDDVFYNRQIPSCVRQFL